MKERLEKLTREKGKLIMKLRRNEKSNSAEWATYTIFASIRFPACVLESAGTFTVNVILIL